MPSRLRRLRLRVRRKPPVPRLRRRQRHRQRNKRRDFRAWAGSPQRSAAEACETALYCCGINVLRPLPIPVGARRPIGLPGCKRIVCPSEKHGQRLADNRARSIDSRESRQSPQAGWNGLLSNAFQFRLQLLLAAAPT